MSFYLTQNKQKTEWILGQNQRVGGMIRASTGRMDTVQQCC